MTKNAYGVEADIQDGNFEDWDWPDYAPMDVVREISVAAAKTVLHDIGQNAFISITSGPDGCFIRLSLGEDMGALSISFAELIDEWVDAGDWPYVGPDLLAALEAALAKVRAAA
jgi:hypothetical protein